MMPCKHVAPMLDAFVDGELSTEKMLELEQHLADCETCLEHLHFIDAMRTSTQRAVRLAAQPSAGFAARLGAALAAERERESLHQINRERFERLRWNVIAPLAAAAMATLVFAGWFTRQRNEMPGAEVPRTQQPMAADMTAEQLLDELVDYHTKPPQPQITEPSLAKDLEPEVGMPVHVPSLKDYGARWESGSVIVVPHSGHAAVFRYRLSNHPVSVYIYNSSRVPLRGALEPRVVHNVAVHVGARRGYTIAALEHRGVGYAVATDLDDDESAELVASIH